MTNIEIIVILLLLEAGLEIDRPPARQFLRDVRTALGFSLLQHPVVIAFASYPGLDFTRSLIASLGLASKFSRTRRRPSGSCSPGCLSPSWPSC